MPSIYVVADLQLTAAAAQSAVATLHLLGTGENEAVADLSIDGGAMALAQPAPGTVQEAGIEFFVGSTQISPDKLRGGFDVARNRRQAMQGGSFGIGLDEWGVSSLGDAFAAIGPPTGIQEIHAFGKLRRDSDGKVYTFDLLRRGIADNMERESSPTAGHFDTYQFHDAAARYARVPITMIFPAGHGLSRPRMAQKMLQQAGETHFAFEAGRAGYMERQFVDAEALSSCQELLDVETRVLRWDRHGIAVCPRLYDPSAPSVATFTEDDILALSAVRLNFPADVITEVTATGTEQIHTSDPPVCGEVASAPIRVETFATFAPFSASFRQAASGPGTLTPLSPGGTLLNALQTLTITRQTTRCGVLVREETETWAYYDPISARYQQNGAAKDPLDFVFIGADGTTEGPETAYLYQRAAWSMIGLVVTRHFYDSPGYRGPDGNFDPETGGLIDHLWTLAFAAGVDEVGDGTGRYLGSITDTFGFFNPLTAIYERGALTDPFDGLDPIDDVFYLGTGETVAERFERFRWTQRVVTVERSNAQRYIESQDQFTYGFGVPAVSGLFQFSDGTISSQQTQTIAEPSRVTTTYLPTAENTHTEVTVTVSGGTTASQVQSGLAGAPPAANYLPGFPADDPTADLTAEDQTLGVTARDGETRPIKVIVSAPSLLTTHLPRAHKASFPYAENLDDLADAADSIIVESLVVAMALTLPFNPLLSEGDVITVTHHPVGVIARRCVIETISWQGSSEPGTPLLTQLGLSIYPVAA